MIEYRKHITRAMLRAEPEKLFVFGDNMIRRGFGGQAKEMRGEPNAIGIPTKWYPSMHKDAFFVDSDSIAFENHSAGEVISLRLHSGIIVWPEDGIGTGRAQLKQRAPEIWYIIEELRLALENHD